MGVILYKCPHCHTIYKLVDMTLEEGGFVLHTDFGDEFKVRCNDHDIYLTKCVGCNHEDDFQSNSIPTEDWIADLFYKVKGN